MSELPRSISPILYVVRCTFSSASVVDGWLSWLQERHLAEVLAAGALSAEVFCIQEAVATYEIHYRFASGLHFERYEQLEAPKLRADGLARFPLAMGLEYERRVGRQLMALDSSDR